MVWRRLCSAAEGISRRPNLAATALETAPFSSRRSRSSATLAALLAGGLAAFVHALLGAIGDEAFLLQAGDGDRGISGLDLAFDGGLFGGRGVLGGAGEGIAGMGGVIDRVAAAGKGEGF